jgi:hypothetical protein
MIVKTVITARDDPSFNFELGIVSSCFVFEGKNGNEYDADVTQSVVHWLNQHEMVCDITINRNFSVRPNAGLRAVNPIVNLDGQGAMIFHKVDDAKKFILNHGAHISMQYTTPKYLIESTFLDSPAVPWQMRLKLKTLEWCFEQDVVPPVILILDHRTMQSTFGSTDVIIYFASEEEASHFKLKWM